MRRNWKALAVCVLIPLLVGGLSGWLTRGSMGAFEAMVKPPLAPPGWLFPVVWTVLFILMGVASYLVLTSGGDEEAIVSALSVYALQLGVNFFWSILFFTLSLCTLAFFWLLLLWVLVGITTMRFYRLSKTAGYLMIPYVLWVTFAAYLNLAICILN